MQRTCNIISGLRRSQRPPSLSCLFMECKLSSRAEHGEVPGEPHPEPRRSCGQEVLTAKRPSVALMEIFVPKHELFVCVVESVIVLLLRDAGDSHPYDRPSHKPGGLYFPPSPARTVTEERSEKTCFKKKMIWCRVLKTNQEQQQLGIRGTRTKDRNK